jgi:acyl-CoA synthetase (AMP-forming)/AMP-acid ligase II
MRPDGGLTVGQIPHRHAQLHSRANKVAVVEGDERLTWRDVSDRTARLANALARQGVNRGTKVAVFLPNRVQYVETVYAVAGLGAAVVPVSYRFVAREVQQALEYSGATTAIIDANLLEVFEAALAGMDRPIPAHNVLVVGPGETGPYRSYDEVLVGSSASLDYLTLDEDDVYHLAFTGGTSGKPKACSIPQRLARQLWYDITVEIGIREHDTMLIAGPFYHGMGFSWALQQLMVGGTIVMQRTFDARGVLQLIDRERITATPMAPTMYTMLLEVADKDTFVVSSMKYLVSAAAPLMSVTKEALMEFFSGAGLFELYGSTEVGFFSVLKPEDQRRKVRCAGLPWAGGELRVLAPNGNEAGPGEVGLIYKRGARLGTGYYEQPDATDKTFGGEWISSGDLGRFDDEGYLYVVDRVDDMIISGGVNIYPTEVEDVLVSHPDIIEAAVTGVAHPKWGQTVVAHVVLREGSAVDEGTLDAFCMERMAAYKRPRKYLFLAELPKNASGKLLKRLLTAS